MADDLDDWLEGGSKGELVSKSRLAALFGKTEVTIAHWAGEGMPVLSKGTRREGWRINTAAAFDWAVARAEASGRGDSGDEGFDAAKVRDKNAQARLREIQIAKAESQLVPRDEVLAFIGTKFGVVRSRFLAVETQVLGLSDDQRAQLHDALVDALTDLSRDDLEEFIDGPVAAGDDSESS